MAKTMTKTARNTPSVKLAKPAESYGLRQLMNPNLWTEKELRAEYSRLRSVANKRLGRLVESGFKTSEAVKQNLNRFEPLKNIKSKEELAARLNEAKRFLGARSSTVTGQREIKEQTIKTLKERGFEIDESNYEEFGKYMEWARRNFQPNFDSEQAADLFTAAKFRGVAVNVLRTNFEVFQRNSELFTDPDFRIPQRTKGRTSATDVFQALGETEPVKRGGSLDAWYDKHSKTGNWAKKRR